MLTVICTNAAIPQPLLQAALSGVADESFNAATIDGDTSTNATVLALANGAGGVRIEKGRLLTEFSEALAELSQALAVEMIRDGEGATKLVTVRVINAPSKTQAASVAKTISHSLLVKTALFGSDGNWGELCGRCVRGVRGADGRGRAHHGGGGAQWRACGRRQLLAAHWRSEAVPERRAHRRCLGDGAEGDHVQARNNADGVAGHRHSGVSGVHNGHVIGLREYKRGLSLVINSRTSLAGKRSEKKVNRPGGPIDE